MNSFIDDVPIPMHHECPQWREYEICQSLANVTLPAAHSLQFTQEDEHTRQEQEEHGQTWENEVFKF